MMPIRELGPDAVRTTPASKVRGLKLEDFLLATKVVRPSVGDLAEVQRWSDTYGSAG